MRLLQYSVTTPPASTISQIGYTEFAVSSVRGQNVCGKLRAIDRPVLLAGGRVTRAGSRNDIAQPRNRRVVGSPAR